LRFYAGASALGEKVVTSRLEVFDEIGVPRRWHFADPAQLTSALCAPGTTVLERRALSLEGNARATVQELERAVVASAV
jgi:hypothetical protein